MDKQTYQASIDEQINQTLARIAAVKSQPARTNQSELLTSLGSDLNSALQPLLKKSAVAVGSWLVRPPKDIGLAEKPDYALPMFNAARELQSSAGDLAAQAVGHLSGLAGLKKVESSGPYLNLWLSDDMVMGSLRQIIDQGEIYGQLSDGAGQIALFDYSSPNVAKPFGINHLRSTVIGESLARLFSAYGYTTVRDNHLGDWGTQFGNLLAAYLTYGQDQPFDSLSIDQLNDLYVRFSEARKASPELVKLGQTCFAKLEAGDPEFSRYWTSALKLSQVEFAAVYKKLGIVFDTEIGESFFVDQAKALVDTLPRQKLKGLVEYDQSTQAVYISGEHPVVLRTGDGYCVYAARDLAAIAFRVRVFAPALVAYVVGEEQASYFRSIFEVAAKAGLVDSQKTELEHIGFGLLLNSSGKKLSSRQGTSGKLKDVIDALDERAEAETKQRNPELSGNEVKAIAKKVAVGALIWNDLKADRTSSVRFDIDSMLRLGGGSVIDVLYSYSRTCSILNKVTASGSDYPSALTNQTEHSLGLALCEFGDVIRKSVAARAPHLLVGYLQDLAKLHGQFYEGSLVIGEADTSVFNLRVGLHQAYKVVIENALKLLNIPPTERL